MQTTNQLAREFEKVCGPIPAIRSAEQFFVLRGKREPFIDGDLMDRTSVIKDIDADYSNLRQIIAISLEAGTCRDATDEITSVVIERWAQDNAELSREARDFVAMCKGEAFANCFRLEDS